METLRTPDDRFADLPDFPWPPTYATTSDGLRMALLDEGPRDAPVSLLLHGEPTWSFLYRKLVPVLLAAGHRVVVPDLIGFGRSDKPLHEADHSYAAHVEWLRSVLFEELHLTDVALLCQDWGGLLGLRLVAEAQASGHGDRFRAVCASNTGLPDGSSPMGPQWQQFRAFVEATPDLPVGFLVTSGCAAGLPPEVQAAYDAPFPDASHKAGPRVMPSLIPQSPDSPGAAENVAAWTALEEFRKPFLCAFSDGDPITAGADRQLLARVPGTHGQPHTTIAGASHFVQEDRGEELARVFAEWLRQV